VFRAALQKCSPCPPANVVMLMSSIALCSARKQCINANTVAGAPGAFPATPHFAVVLPRVVFAALCYNINSTTLNALTTPQRSMATARCGLTPSATYLFRPPTRHCVMPRPKT
jgi:hypothetical protein